MKKTLFVLILGLFAVKAHTQTDTTLRKIPLYFHELEKTEGYEQLDKLFFANSNPKNTNIESIINVSIGGAWGADGINYFQNKVRIDFLNNTPMYVEILKTKNKSNIRSFFYFLFDNIHQTKNKLPFKNYMNVKKYDKSIFKIMKSTYSNVIKDAKLFQVYKEY